MFLPEGVYDLVEEGYIKRLVRRGHIYKKKFPNTNLN